MNKVEKIKAYLEDRRKKLEDIKNRNEWTTAELGDLSCCKQTLSFIDSLEEEPVSEDLEKEIQRYYNEMDGDCRYMQTARHFARWQKQQVMKDAVDGFVCAQRTNGEVIVRTNFIRAGLALMEKVKLIIIKDENY